MVERYVIFFNQNPKGFFLGIGCIYKPVKLFFHSINSQIYLFAEIFND